MARRDQDFELPLIVRRKLGDCAAVAADNEVRVGQSSRTLLANPNWATMSRRHRDYAFNSSFRLRHRCWRCLRVAKIGKGQETD